MSRHRLIAKVRKNPDYVEAARILDELGLDHELVPPPSGRGHPRLRIAIGDQHVDHVIACTPRGRINLGRVRGELKTLLRQYGVAV